MSNKCLRRVGILIAVTLLGSTLILAPLEASAVEVSPSLKTGPYIDKILFKVIPQENQQALALLDNEIDIIGDFINPIFFQTIDVYEIDVTNTLRNGYGYIYFNCAKYPYNITDFRRAIAFALDKEGIADTVWDGLAEPLDSCVPMNNPFSIEGQLDYSYYEADVEYGNYLLDRAGFQINSTTGFRTAPNGSELYVGIESPGWTNIAIETGVEVVAACSALNIEAELIPNDFYGWPEPRWLNDFDIIFSGKTFQDFRVDWLANEYWSETAGLPDVNRQRFGNDTFDSWRNQLLYSTDYDEVYEAALEMQKIITYECPIIVCYQNRQLSVYRTDKFEGFVNDVLLGVPNWWTLYRVHLRESEGGPLGGTLRWGLPLDIDSFNVMSSYSIYTRRILNGLYDSLVRQGPDGEDINWLAESYTIATHEDDPNVPLGHTRMTFNILDNASWTDGYPLTAEDIAFSLNYYRDIPDGPYEAELTEMASAYAPTNYVLIIDFDTESWWHIKKVIYKPVIPKHVFERIGVEVWNTTEPDPLNETMVTSGPFNISAYVPGEYLELTRNPNYFFEALILSEITTTEIDDSSTELIDTTVPTQNAGGILGDSQILSIALTLPSLTIIVVILIKWKKGIGEEG